MTTDDERISQSIARLEKRTMNNPQWLMKFIDEQFSKSGIPLTSVDNLVTRFSHLWNGADDLTITIQPFEREKQVVVQWHTKYLDYSMTFNADGTAVIRSGPNVKAIEE